MKFVMGGGDWCKGGIVAYCCGCGCDGVVRGEDVCDGSVAQGRLDGMSMIGCNG